MPAFRRLPATLLPGLLVFLPSLAAAQTEPSVDARTWRPSMAPEAGLVLEPTQSPGPWQWNAGAWVSYSHMPVVLRDAQTNAVASDPLAHVLGADLVAGVGLGDRAAIGVDVPVYLFQDGTSGLPPSVVSGGKVPASGIGDVSILGKGTLLRNDPHGVPLGFGLAALGAFSLPTGDRASFASDGSVTVSLRLLAEYALGVGALRATLGYSLRTAQQTWPVPPTLGGSTFGDELPWSIGATLRPKGVFPSLDSGDRQSWEIAFHGALPVTPVAPFQPGASSLSPTLLAFDDRISLGHYRDTYVLAGADVGLDTSVGVPAIRVVLAVGWAPRAHDRDGDGIPDDVDECPDLAEDFDGIQDEDGCPEDDADGDGILDTQDACPLVPGVWWNDPKKNGCPAPDTDGDGIPDPVDACPAVKGVRSDDPRKNGCPGASQDRDKDGIPDDADKCPDQPEDMDGFEDFDGCPDPDDDGDGIPDKEDACPRVKGEPSTDPTRNGCPNPDRDGDTYDNDVDRCPDEPEVFNGVKDDDGCPDEGGRPLVVVDVVKGAVMLHVVQPILFTGTTETLAIDPRSATTLRAIALEMNRRPDWTLAVGARPGTGKPEEAQRGSLERAVLVANRIATYTHRPGSAEAVGWDAVKQQPGAASGVGFLVLLSTREKPALPLSDKKDPGEKVTRRAHAAAAALLALATSAGTEAHAQPMPMHPPRAVGPGRRPPPQVAPRPTATVEGPIEDLRGRFGVDIAQRLLRSSDVDERLRGLERAAATRTPEGLALLERAAGAGLPGGVDPRAPIDGVARQDPRGLLVVVRGLASWIDRDPARTALEALLREPSQAFTPRASAAGRDPAADEADSVGRVLLARQEAAMALAQSGATAPLEALLATARSATPGQAAALEALAVHPPVTPLLGGVAVTTPGTVALAAELGDLRSLGAILGAVHASDPALRSAAVAALGLSGDARALDVAREAGKDKDARVRVAGAEALVHLGAADAAQAVETLVADEATAREALRIAVDVRSEGVTKAAAARAVASADPELRALAVVALGRQVSPAAVNALVTLAGDAILAGNAMDALARSPCPVAMAAIETIAGVASTRRLAARAYFVRRAVRGERSARGDALLAALAASGDGAERALGVEALVALRERPLADALGDPDPRVRRAAAMGSVALGSATGANAEALTARLAIEPDETTRELLSVGLLGGDPGGAVPTMTLLDRTQAGGSDAPLAALALARRADEALSPRVDALLASRDPVVRGYVARGLAAANAPDAVGRLARAYAWEPVAEVRRALIAALAARPHEEHAAPSWREALEVAAHLEPDRVTRAAAQRALADLAPLRPSPGREVAWLRVMPAEGATLPREMTGTLIDASGAALPIVFDEEGYALVPGLPPGDSRLRLAPRLPAYEAR